MGTEVEMAYRRAKLAKYCVDVLGSLREVHERRRVGTNSRSQARSKRPKMKVLDRRGKGKDGFLRHDSA